MTYRRGFTIVLACGLLSAAACSDEPAPVADANPSGGNGVCIQTDFIDHTEIPDDSTILFYMKGGPVWKNSLHFSCTSLKNEGGFAYVTNFPEVCSNAQTIRVVRSGILCELGQFTPYTPPPALGAPSATPK